MKFHEGGGYWKMQRGSGMFQGELKIQRGCPYGLKVIDDRRDAQRWEFIYKKKYTSNLAFLPGRDRVFLLFSWSKACRLSFFLNLTFFLCRSLFSFFS